MTSKERATDLLNTTLFHCFDGEEFGLSAKHAVAVADALDTAGVLAPDDAAFRALVETATALGMKLGKAEGRKQALTEAAGMLAAASEAHIRRARDWKPTDSTNFKTQDGAIGLATGYQRAAERVRSMPPLATGATSDALTASTGHSDLPEGRGGL